MHGARVRRTSLVGRGGRDCRSGTTARYSRAVSHGTRLRSRTRPRDDKCRIANVGDPDVGDRASLHRRRAQGNHPEDSCQQGDQDPYAPINEDPDCNPPGVTRCLVAARFAF